MIKSIIKYMGLGLALFTTTLSSVMAEEKPVTISTEGAFAPWNFTRPSGELDGFEVELSKNLCERLQVKCVFVTQDFSGAIPALNARKFDAIISGMNVTPQRSEAVNFTRFYVQVTYGFAAMKDNPLFNMSHKDDIVHVDEDTDDVKTTFADLRTLLKGKTIGVQGATTNSDFVKKYFGDIATIRDYQTTEQHDLDLLAGRIDVVFAAKTVLSSTMQQPDFADMAIVGPTFTGKSMGEGTAMAFRKSDNTLRDKFDGAIQQAIDDGTIKALSEKWFNVDLTPKQ